MEGSLNELKGDKRQFSCLILSHDIFYQFHINNDSPFYLFIPLTSKGKLLKLVKNVL